MSTWVGCALALAIGLGSVVVMLIILKILDEMDR